MVTETTGGRLSHAVLAAIADREGVEIEDLQPPLYHSIDPSALDDLFRDGDGMVRFEYLDYDVTVDQGGDVTIERAHSHSEE